MGTEVWLVLLVMVLRLGARWLVALRRELTTDISEADNCTEFGTNWSIRFWPLVWFGLSSDLSLWLLACNYVC